MFVPIRALFCSGLIGGNLTAQSKASHRGIGGGIQIPETKLQALLLQPPTPPPPSPPPPLTAAAARAPGELAPRLDEFNFKIQTSSWVLSFQQAYRLKLNCLKAFTIKSLKPDSASLKPRAFVRLWTPTVGNLPSNKWIRLSLYCVSRIFGQNHAVSFPTQHALTLVTSILLKGLLNSSSGCDCNDITTGSPSALFVGSGFRGHLLGIY